MRTVNLGSSKGAGSGSSWPYGAEYGTAVVEAIAGESGQRALGSTGSGVQAVGSVRLRHLGLQRGEGPPELRAGVSGLSLPPVLKHGPRSLTYMQVIQGLT